MGAGQGGGAMGERRAADYLAFFRAVEPFKDVLRNSWTAQGRRESAAEHSWRLCLMAVALEDELAAWTSRSCSSSW
jgi:putative hydrolases of HD superfamily